jgi:hypothetical protein
MTNGNGNDSDSSNSTSNAKATVDGYEGNGNGQNCDDVNWNAEWWVNLLVRTLERSGATFIKVIHPLHTYKVPVFRFSRLVTNYVAAIF